MEGRERHVRRMKGRNSSSDVRLEGFTAVTIKSATFWNIKTQLVPHSLPLAVVVGLA
jgi:hypothetical protein